MSTATAPVSRTVVVYALAFASGALAALVGLVTGGAPWFLAAGACFIVSGTLILVGSRITFGGPAGNVVRAVLGPARVRGVNLRAIFWIVTGLLLCLWSLDGMRRTRDDEQLLEDPLVQSND